MRLSPEEARVVGSLIEKELTTPQQYPLTLNALVLACNQSSNRDPVVQFDESTVEAALARMKADALVRFVYPSHGRSVTRYQQLLGEHLEITRAQLALLALLLLRGPQTAGELRARADRMYEFHEIARVETELEYLSKMDEPAVARLARRPGQKEERWAQLLTGTFAEASIDALVLDAGGVAPERAASAAAGGDRRPDMAVQMIELRSLVMELKDQLVELQRQVAELRDRRPELRPEA